MKTKLALLIVFLFGLLTLPANVRAQTEPSSVVQTLKPISAEVRAALNAWLAVSAPEPVPYYAVTYSRMFGMEYTFVSLVALNLTTPDEEWTFTEGEDGTTKVLWWGSVKVYADGTVEKYVAPDDQPLAVKRFELAALDFVPLLSPNFSAGGGAYVRFPWQSAKAVKYGVLGVHDMGYSYNLSEHWAAVDLVSGSDMGSGAASDKVYASVGGTVDYVCEGSTATTVGLSGNGDKFIYAHLEQNANLIAEHTFSQGSMIGTLVHGSFVDTCGYAVQQDDHWHLHWGFITKGNTTLNSTFQAEGCILFGTNPGTWTCGTTEVKPNGYLTHYGDLLTGEEDGAAVTLSFWDYLVTGAKDIFDALFTNNLPEHGSPSTFITPILNGIKIVFRIASVLLRGNFNFMPAIAAVVIVLSIKIAMASVYIVVGIARMIKA